MRPTALSQTLRSQKYKHSAVSAVFGLMKLVYLADQHHPEEAGFMQFTTVEKMDYWSWHFYEANGPGFFPEDFKKTLCSI